MGFGNHPLASINSTSEVLAVKLKHFLMLKL